MPNSQVGVARCFSSCVERGRNSAPGAPAIDLKSLLSASNWASFAPLFGGASITIRLIRGSARCPSVRSISSPREWGHYQIAEPGGAKVDRPDPVEILDHVGEALGVLGHVAAGAGVAEL